MPNPSRAGGRPKLGPEKRIRALTVFFSELEYSQLINQFGQRKMADVVRELLMNGSVNVYHPFQPVNELLRSQLIHTLNNLNQLIKSGYQTGIINQDDVKSEVAEAKYLINQIALDLRAYKS